MRDKLIFIITIAFVIVVIPITAYGEMDRKLHNELSVTFFSLPDGESTLLQTDDGVNIMINTGAKKSQDELLHQLEELKISKIDKLILTNQTTDYCGNSKRLIERFQIKNTVYSGQLSDACYQNVKNSTLTNWSQKDQLEVNSLNIDVLMAKATGEMSLGITYGKTSIMYMGNSDLEDEEQLLNHPIKPKILKIANYAQGESPSSAFLSKIDPHISIVFNCGECKPNEGMIERLNESWIDVYQLSKVGTTIIRMDLENYEILS